MSSATPPSRVAFASSGGASLGAIQVGMLRALLHRGIVRDTMVAASVGAVNGAFLALHGPTAETVDELAALWRMIRAEAAAGAFLSGRDDTQGRMPSAS